MRARIDFPYCYRGELSDAPSDGRSHPADRVAHCGCFDSDHAEIPQLHRCGVLDFQRPAGSRIAEVASPLIPTRGERALTIG